MISTLRIDRMKAGMLRRVVEGRIIQTRLATSDRLYPLEWIPKKESGHWFPFERILDPDEHVYFHQEKSGQTWVKEINNGLVSPVPGGSLSKSEEM
jgi:hypothetical protein